MLQLEKNIKNKTWWVAVISAILLLAQSHGFDLTKYIGTNWQDTLNTIFSLLVLFGVSVDTTVIKTTYTSTKPVESNADVETSSDKSIDIAISNTVQALNDNQSNTSNEKVGDTSASSKIAVDNPDNNVSVGAVVNSISASTPQ